MVVSFLMTTTGEQSQRAKLLALLTRMTVATGVT
jgi:hypothetical protein